MTFMTSVGRGNGEVLQFATCLHILLFLNGRYVVYLADGVAWVVVGEGGDVIIWSLILKLALVTK